jgi:hypothetical protein
LRQNLAGERHAQCWHRTDGVLVAAPQNFFGRYDQTILRQRYLAQFDIPVFREFVPTDLADA